MQAHARGGEWPRLYSAVAHVDMDLGYIGQALYRVRLRNHFPIHSILPCAVVPSHNQNAMHAALHTCV